MGVTKEQLIDFEKATDYCDTFYEKHKLALHAMAFGAQAAATTFTSVFTEKKQKEFLKSVAENVFLLALGAAPGGFVLSSTWATMMAGRTAVFVKRSEWLLSQVPAAAQTAAKAASDVTAERDHFESRTAMLRRTLVKIGTNIFNQMNALFDERDRARQTIYNALLNDNQAGGKCWATLEGFARELLGPHPNWNGELLGTVTQKFEKALFKTYVDRKVTISNPQPLVYELYNGLEDAQYDYIKQNFAEIKKVEDLRFKWKAQLKPRSYSRYGYGW